LRQTVDRLDQLRLAVTDSGIMDDGVEPAEPVDLVGDGFRLRDVGKVTDDDVLGAPTFLRVSSARAALRACRTTLCPCSISSSAAILPRPSAEPVTKTRAILKISLAVSPI